MTEKHMTNQDFSTYSCSTIRLIPKKESEIDQIIEHHMTNEDFSS
jgi:transcription termination factor NusB